MSVLLCLKEIEILHGKFDIKIEYNGKDIGNNDINIGDNDKYGYIGMNLNIR